MNPSSFCTIATDGVLQDLFGLLTSLSITNPGAKLYILCDSVIHSYFQECPFPLRLKIEWKVCLNQYTGKRRADMEKEGIWADFQMEKTNSLLWAFEQGEPDVMFLDADLFLLRPIEISNYQGEDVILSPHCIRSTDEAKFGKYNGGVFWTKNPQTIQTWRDHFATSRFYDQACLEDVARLHSVCEMNEGQNMSWWRIFQGDLPPQELLKQFQQKDDGLYYKEFPVQFIHTHLFDKTGIVGKFNMFIAQKMIEYPRLFLLMMRCIQGHWNVILPKQPMPGMWGHSNDSFRELAHLWEEHSLVSIQEAKTSGNCWFGFVGGVLLYDRPTLSWMNGDPFIQKAKIRLFGNPSPPSEKDYSWIFWARRPRILEDTKEECRKSQRNTNVVFIGNMENSVQESHRTRYDWGSVVDDFILTKGSKYQLSHLEYIQRIGKSKFGLCLRGYGQKCHRETELMGVGTVPIVTPDCDMTHYANPLLENTHYLVANTPEDIPRLIASISQEQWETMSQNCIDWWEANCSIRGSFKTTLNQIFYQ